ELLQILAHFLYIFCTISVQFSYGIYFLYVFCMFSYVFCMFSVRSFFIGLQALMKSLFCKYTTTTEIMSCLELSSANVISTFLCNHKKFHEMVSIMHLADIKCDVCVTIKV